MQTTNRSFRHHFLMAMPYLQDPNFSGTLTYICDHSDDGAFGLIINRPLDVAVDEVLDQLALGGAVKDVPVYGGGPVMLERGFVLHRPRGQWQSSIGITDSVGLTTSRDILAALGTDLQPRDWLIALGYAGWGAGQLEQELAGNFWLTCPANEEILFETPYHLKLDAALALLGIDRNQLTNTVGHA